MPDFHGHPTHVLQNDHLRLEYLTQAGPRIVRLFLQGHEDNLLGEFPEIGWDLPGGRFQIFGGHRLWAAPETPGVSYGLTVNETASGVDLTFDPGPDPGLVMNVQVSLIPNRAAVTVAQAVTNRFDHPMRIAPWGITVFPLGGRAYLPCPPSGKDLLPDRSLVLWPYVRWDDARLQFGPDAIVIDAAAGLPPVKVGTFTPSGCCAYLRNDILFVKRFGAGPGEYPDRGCNAEVFCSDRLIEIESLAPLAEVPPGGTVRSTETWEIHTGERALQMLNDISSIGDPS
jgi:hypothetical protein